MTQNVFKISDHLIILLGTGIVEYLDVQSYK